MNKKYLNIETLTLIHNRTLFRLKIDIKVDRQTQQYAYWEVGSIENYSTYKSELSASDIAYDVSTCPIDYVFEIIARRKGSINAVIRSLYAHKESIWLNKVKVYSKSCKTMIDRKGICDGVPCFACPGSYIEDNTNTTCNYNGWASSAHIYLMKDSQIVESCKKYLTN